jgi:hypothetical protein
MGWAIIRQATQKDADLLRDILEASVEEDPGFAIYFDGPGRLTIRASSPAAKDAIKLTLYVAAYNVSYLPSDAAWR